MYGCKLFKNSINTAHEIPSTYIYELEITNLMSFDDLFDFTSPQNTNGL